jgi:putative ATPase
MGKKDPEDDGEGLFGEPNRPRRAAGSGDGPPSPLADRMRPRSWDEVVGQEHLTAPGAPLRQLHGGGRLSSLILWGPPGSGKTSLAGLLSDLPGYAEEHFSAVLSGVRDVREVVERARRRWDRDGMRTVLFVDEIHRFNRAQQDAFLPHVEAGRIVLIGATTENPSFEVIPALLSRCSVYVLKPLDDSHLRSLGERALRDPDRGLANASLLLDDPGWDVLLRHAALDGRRLLNTLEMVAATTAPGTDGVRRPDASWVARVCERPIPVHQGREDHYDLISALHKSLRGSDPHASLYWLARMLEAGEDPRYIVRRLVRFASEDVGLADPSALHHANAATSAYTFVGSPEGHLALAQLVVYLAMCPKSNSIYVAYGRAAAMVHELGPLPVPLRIRNAPTRLMDDLGYGHGYRYPHEVAGRWVPESYLPDRVPVDRSCIYEASDQGREPEIARAHRNRTKGFYDAPTGETPGALPGTPATPDAPEAPGRR